MTGDGGEYLRPEDLKELGDDSLPGQYLDGMNYLRFSLEGGRSDRYRTCRNPCLCGGGGVAPVRLEQSALQSGSAFPNRPVYTVLN